MKNTIYKIGFLLLAFTIVLSCESPEAETNYKPATPNYEYPTAITLGPGIVTNSSFQFTVNIAGAGEAYYVAVESGNDAPSNNDVFDGDASGLITSGSFDLTGSPVTITVDEGLCDATTYDIYVVHFTSDAFLSETTTDFSITTNDNGSIAGTYDTVTNGDLSGNFGGSVVDYEGVVTITDNGDGTFTFDDTTAGIYPDPNYYGSFGSPAVPYTFEVPCNEINGAFITPFWNCCDDWIGFEGVINDDGSISVHWESAFGEVMDVVYTKQTS